MSKQQMSKNEPVDKTVDLKLGKWREKSIAMEERTQKRGGRTQTAGKIQVFHAGFYRLGA